MFDEPKKAAISKMQKQTLLTARHVLLLGAWLAVTIAAAPAFAAKTKAEPAKDTAKTEPAKPVAAKQRMIAPQAPKQPIKPASGNTLHPASGALKNHTSGTLKSGKMHYVVASSGGISCVPYARAATGMNVKGNAANWWANSAGLYERGYRPEPGSILNFRATGRMRLGHVAVVSNVLNAREVTIDHANWAGPGLRKGMVSKSVKVIDVSEGNDWSAVRVALGDGDTFGSVYPTYGFIYDRPDRGTMVANTLGRSTPRYEEVAEAAPTPRAKARR